VAIVGTDFSEERITSILWAKRISKLGTMLANGLMLWCNVPPSSSGWKKISELGTMLATYC
jgi:hypothetical protein